jgi:hypothetical protein
MSEVADSFSFSYLPLIIRMKCEESGKVPLFLGSALRGALGWLLQESKSDVYTYLFDNQSNRSSKAHLVKPYIIEPPKPKEYYQEGDVLQFSLIFLGKAELYAAEVTRILTKQSFLKIGAKRLPFKLLSITHGTTYKTIWEDTKPTLAFAHLTSGFISSEKQIGHWGSLQIQTPLRIRRQGKLVTDLDFPTLIRNITTRMTELTEGYGGSVNNIEIEKLCEEAKCVSLNTVVTHFHKMERFSNKLNEKMDFSGIMGVLTFEGELTPYTPWLNAAQLLHIGRNTTFGCGKIEIVIT